MKKYTFLSLVVLGANVFTQISPMTSKNSNSKNISIKLEDIVYLDGTMNQKMSEEDYDNQNNSNVMNNYGHTNNSNQLSRQNPRPNNETNRQSFTQSAWANGDASETTNEESNQVKERSVQPDGPEPSKRKTKSVIILNEIPLDMKVLVKEVKNCNSPTHIQQPDLRAQIEPKQTKLTLQELEAIRIQDVVKQAEKNYRKKSEKILKNQSESAKAVTKVVLEKDSKSTHETIGTSIKQYIIYSLQKAYTQAYSGLLSENELKEQAEKKAQETYNTHQQALEQEKELATRKALEKEKAEEAIKELQKNSCCIIL